MSTRLGVVEVLEDAGWCSSCDRMVSVALLGDDGRPTCCVCHDLLVFAKDEPPEETWALHDVLDDAPKTRSATMARSASRINATTVYQAAVILAAIACCVFEKACK